MDRCCASFRRVERADVGPCLVAQGEIDDHVTDEFTDAVADVVCRAEGAAVLDLTGVTYLGSNGIGALIIGEAAAEDAGVRLMIEPSTIVRRVLETTAMDSYFELHDRV